MTTPRPERTATVLVYLGVIGLLGLVKLVLIFNPWRDVAPDPDFLRNIAKLSLYLGPLAVSSVFASRTGKPIPNDKTWVVAGWCLLAEVVGDVAGLLYVFVAGMSGIMDFSGLESRDVGWAAIALALRYIVAFPVLWLLLRFPGKWLAQLQLRRRQIAA